MAASHQNQGLCSVLLGFQVLTFTRLLKETGRFSNSPVFVVGIFSGADQLGEGFGASLRMAEFRVRPPCLQRV